MPAATADALVLFGATGDLAKKKLFPALYHDGEARRAQGAGDRRRPQRLDRREFRQHAHDAIIGADPDARAAAIDAVRPPRPGPGRLRRPSTWESLRDTLDRPTAPTPSSTWRSHRRRSPPSRSLASVGLNDRGRIVVEKPFGRDLASARELNDTLHAAFPEQRIFRIDHYLGKESVEDLLVFRFSNTLLEPIWNRNYVRSVQVTMAETIGVEGRGAFYDSVGALRDVVQNHLLQVVTLLAMEPPVDADPSHLQDEKAKVLEAMRPICCDDLVRGQYAGYRDEHGVAKDSTAETFVAMRMEIDSWRWAGVPWYVRAGKALATAATEAVVELHSPPRMLFDEAGGRAAGRNLIRFRLGKRDGVTFTLQAKTPGADLDSQDVDVQVDFAAALGERREAYERLLEDALAGAPAALRPRGRRGADLAHRPAGARRPRRGAPLLAAAVGPGGSVRVLPDGDHWFDATS